MKIYLRGDDGVMYQLNLRGAIELIALLQQSGYVIDENWTDAS